jgi:hypothetical protein
MRLLKPLLMMLAYRKFRGRRSSSQGSRRRGLF